MALLRYETSTGYVILEWLEEKEGSSPTPHHFSKVPSYLQLHPIDEYMVVRAHFTGAMPTWIKRYTKKHHLKAAQITKDGKVAWWISNWKFWNEGKKPLTAPNLDGSLNQLKGKIPDVVEELRDRIDQNREIMKQNLIWYPDAYKDLGLAYRREEVIGQGGCVIFDDTIIPEREDEMSEQDYRNSILRDGRLERLIHEMGMELPESIEKVEQGDFVVSFEEDEEIEELSLDLSDFFIDEDSDEEEELVMDDFSLEKRTVEEALIEEELAVDGEGEEVVLTDGPQEFTAEFPEDERQVDEQSEPMMETVLSEDTQLVEEGVVIEKVPNEEPIVTEAKSSIIEDSYEQYDVEEIEVLQEDERQADQEGAENDNGVKTSDEVSLKKVEIRDKKSKATEGQFALF